MDTTNTQPRGVHGPGLADERRKEARFDCRRMVDLLPCAGDADWSFLKARMTDCSVHGIGVILDRAMQAGDRFMIKLRLGGSMSVVLYTVRDCRAVDQGYRVGAEFSGYLLASGDTSRETIVEALMRS